MLVEHAITKLAVSDAVHEEYGDEGTPVVSALSCSLAGTQIEVTFAADSRMRRWYGTDVAIEQTTCNYGMNPAFQDQASAGGLFVSAVDDTGEVRAVERRDHPFFVATLYQPQLTSSPDAPHPLFLAFVLAAKTCRL